MERVIVEVGQLWMDNDPRMGKRQLKVVRVEVEYAFCQVVHGSNKMTRIRLDRFKQNSTGYRLVQSAQR
jgi:hypothetical protein